MKKLEQLFNLPEAKEIVDDENEKAKQQAKELKKDKINKQRALQKFAEYDKISSALPAVKGLGDLADTELNDISQRALKAYEDLMDLGMNIEPRYSARMFEVASSMLKTGLEAQTAKIDKKLKMVDLQLKKEKLDKEEKKEPKTKTKTIEAEGYLVTDRNSLIERLKNSNIDK